MCVYQIGMANPLVDLWVTSQAGSRKSQGKQTTRGVHARPTILDIGLLHILSNRVCQGQKTVEMQPE